MTPLSTTDYPGEVAAVLFLQGCPWRCSYCHNQDLVRADLPARLAWSDAIAFLRRRVGLLDAVVFSGGEPTMQYGLAEAAREVKELGFRIGLHTGGAYPEKLREVLPLVDWVGLDIKGKFRRYDAINGVPGSGAMVETSLRLLVNSGVDYECRTTVHPELFTLEELVSLSISLFALGARRHVLQAFRSEGCRDAGLNAAFDPVALAGLLTCAAAATPGVELRGV